MATITVKFQLDPDEPTADPSNETGLSEEGAARIHELVRVFGGYDIELEEAQP